MTDFLNIKSTAAISTGKSLPLARGLTSWPAAPPRFDLLDVDPSSVQKGDIATVETPKISGDDLGAWIDRLTNSGFHANRQNCPDVIEQLNLAIRRPVDTIICSVLDVDPSACVQSATAAARPADVLAGVALLQRCCGAANARIVIDSRVPESWWSAARASARPIPNVKIIELTHAYPQADPTLLLYTLTDRRLQPGHLPPELGAIILDAVAAASIGALALRNEASPTLPIVVRDHDHHESFFLIAPASLTIADVLRRLNCDHDIDTKTVRVGDLLRDVTVELSTALRDTELVIHLATRAVPINPESCIRCGWCFEACPTRVRPAMLFEAAQTQDETLAEHAGLRACIQCGICTYVCPSRLPLLQSIRTLLPPNH